MLRYRREEGKSFVTLLFTSLLDRSAPARDDCGQLLAVALLADERCRARESACGITV
jgi:hypothetical protein